MSKHRELAQVCHQQVGVGAVQALLRQHQVRGLQGDIHLQLLPVSHCLLQTGRCLGLELVPGGRGSLGESEMNIPQVTWRL